MDNKIEYFLEQSNKSPFTKDWRFIYGEITLETIKKLKFKIEGSNTPYEVTKFSERLNNFLNRSVKYYDKAYKDFRRLDKIPKFIYSIIDELLEDTNFKIQILKERKKIEIPINTGLVMPDKPLKSLYESFPGGQESITRLSFFAGLGNKGWLEFLEYLLFYNYVLPITYLGLPEIYEVATNKKGFLSSVSKLYEKVKPVPRKDRRRYLINFLLQENEREMIMGFNRESEMIKPEEIERKIGRGSRYPIRKFLENMQLSEGEINRILKTIGKRRHRSSIDWRKGLKKLESYLASMSSPVTTS